MPRQMSLMGRIISPDGYISSPFCCLHVGEGDILLRRCLWSSTGISLFHHSLCSTPRYFPVPVRPWKCLSALANFDKYYTALKVIQLHMDNLRKIEANTSLWVCCRWKTRLKLMKFLKHSVMDLAWKWKSTWVLQWEKTKLSSVKIIPFVSLIF